MGFLMYVLFMAFCRALAVLAIGIVYAFLGLIHEICVIGMWVSRLFAGKPKRNPPQAPPTSQAYYSDRR